jgi:xanthine dehydrogenase YagT iron-sulfur-binding subunit
MALHYLIGVSPWTYGPRARMAIVVRNAPRQSPEDSTDGTETQLQLSRGDALQLAGATVSLAVTPGAGGQSLSHPAPTEQVRLIVNGEARQIEIDARQSLLDVLRERLDLTGTKKGCDQGQCGACTVLVDGRRVLSCLTLAVTKDGASITTIEGLAREGSLHPLQQAFIDHDAFQCGYCTPGQICSAAGLIAEGRARTADEVRELMSGNICRCGAYPNIVAAIQQVLGQS